jgi:hypothetical protein
MLLRNHGEHVFAATLWRNTHHLQIPSNKRVLYMIFKSSMLLRVLALTTGKVTYKLPTQEIN